MSSAQIDTRSSWLELTRDTDGAVQPSSRETAAIYIHYPFCQHLCTYCDFDKFVGLERLREPYVEAVVEQIRHSPAVQGVSLYVGGGTPSLMAAPLATKMMDACRERFSLPASVEQTLEANPSGLGMTELRAFREVGFNRLSLGVQSADARLLRLLGRRHRHVDSCATVEAARQAGFRNISVDLIYGLPYQTQESWRSTLEAVAAWDVEHVSCYMLSIEAGTPLERGVSRGTIPTLSDDEAVEMYQVANDFLGSAGYHRYEISNWARPGHESAHNLAYWRNQSYLGIGAGAAGSWRGRRYKVRPHVPGFIEGARHGSIPLSEDESIDRHRSMSDTLILGLRLAEGVSREQFYLRYDEYPEAGFGEALEWGERSGLLKRDAVRLVLTEEGILLSNELFARLL